MNTMRDLNPIYIFENKPMPWGDYGAILLAGMTGHSGRRDGILQLERTGPFIPPIIESGIGAYVVTDACRRQLEQSGLTGFSFKPVHKKKIVELRWDKWDITRHDPQEYPPEVDGYGGEPEDYILENPHNENIAREMGDVWELVSKHCGSIDYVQRGDRILEHDVFFVYNKQCGCDIFSDNNGTYLFLNKSAKQFFESIVGQWIQLRELPETEVSRYLIRSWDEDRKWFDAMKKRYNPSGRDKKIPFVQNEIPKKNMSSFNIIPKDKIRKILRNK